MLQVETVLCDLDIHEESTRIEMELRGGDEWALWLPWKWWGGKEGKALREEEVERRWSWWWSWSSWVWNMKVWEGGKAMVEEQGELLLVLWCCEWCYHSFMQGFIESVTQTHRIKHSFLLLLLLCLFEVVVFGRRRRRRRRVWWRGWWRSQEFGSHSHGDRVFRKRDGDDDRYADRKTAIFRLRDRQQREKTS